MVKNSYRKTYFNEAQTKNLYFNNKDLIHQLHFDLKFNHLHGAEAIAILILKFLYDFHGKNFIGSIRQQQTSSYPWKLKDRNYLDLEFLIEFHPIEAFEKFNFKTCPHRIHTSLINWYLGKWSLELTYKDPEAIELLEIQCTGKRIICFPTSLQDFTIKDGRDPLSFLFHDLFHAERFFSEVQSPEGQIEFFKKLKQDYDLGKFDKLLQNEDFKKDFDYLMADMNTHPEHQSLYLNAILKKHQSEKIINQT